MTDDMPQLLKGEDVAKMFSVHPNTVAKWAKLGLLPCIRTPGTHRRYWYHEIEPYLTGEKTLT